MRLTKRYCNEEAEIEVSVYDTKREDETLIGFENRLIDIVNKLITQQVIQTTSSSDNED